MEYFLNERKCREASGSITYKCECYPLWIIYSVVDVKYCKCNLTPTTFVVFKKKPIEGLSVECVENALVIPSFSVHHEK